MSKIYKAIDIIDGLPTFEKPLNEILSEVKRNGGIKTLDPLEFITAQQRRWYKGICLRGLSEWNGDTVDEWDLQLKDKCNGVELLKKIPITLTLFGQEVTVNRLTVKGVGKRKMMQFIENILSYAITNDLPVTPPDKELRK